MEELHLLQPTKLTVPKPEIFHIIMKTLVATSIVSIQIIVATFRYLTETKSVAESIQMMGKCMTITFWRDDFSWKRLYDNIREDTSTPENVSPKKKVEYLPGFIKFIVGCLLSPIAIFQAAKALTSTQQIYLSSWWLTVGISIGAGAVGASLIVSIFEWLDLAEWFWEEFEKGRKSMRQGGKESSKEVVIMEAPDEGSDEVEMDEKMAEEEKNDD